MPFVYPHRVFIFPQNKTGNRSSQDCPYPARGFPDTGLRVYLHKLSMRTLHNPGRCPIKDDLFDAYIGSLLHDIILHRTERNTFLDRILQDNNSLGP